MKIISAKSFFRLAVVAVFLALIALALHYFWRWKTLEYKRQLQASGEKLSVAELSPAPVPAEQNGAPTFQQAAATLKSPTGVLKTNAPSVMHMVGPGKAMVGWAQSDIRDETDRVTNSWNDLEAELSTDSEALNALRQLTNYPVLDFGVSYELTGSPPDKWENHFEPERQGALVLATSVENELHRGNAALAAADLRAMLALVRATQDERTVASQLVRIAIARMAMASTWEYLQSPRLTDEELASVQSAWSQLEFRQAAENALMMERAMTEELLAKARQSSVGYQKILGENQSSDSLQRAMAKSKQIFWRLWWSHPDELRALKGFEVLLNGARFVQTNYAFRSKILEQHAALSELGVTPLTHRDWWEIGPANPTLRTFFSQSVTACYDFLEVVQRAEICRQMALTTLALKRYQLKHGNYAPELAALVPEFLPAVPRDPIDGKPLRYQLVGNSYLLYSIGEDGVDNGGDPVPVSTSDTVSSWMQGRDSVWPEPATEQEIQAYENKLLFKGKSTQAQK